MASFPMLSDDSVLNSPRDDANDLARLRPQGAWVRRITNDSREPVGRQIFLARIIATCFGDVNVRVVVKIQRITITQQAKSQPLSFIADSPFQRPCSKRLGSRACMPSAFCVGVTISQQSDAAMQ